GGLGFIGSHTVQALLDAGEECVLVQRSHAEVPAGRFDAPVAVEQADATDPGALLAIGRRHRITGIVHLAGSMPWPPSSGPAVQAARRSLGSLFNIMQAAQEWGVGRVALASTIGVYAGAKDPFEGALTEEMPLSMSAPHLIPTFKKVSELLGGHLANATGVEVVNLRISGTWGPRGHNPDPFFPAPQLIHAAAHGGAPDLSGVSGRMHAEDSLDLCYVKDTGRAIALLQLTDHLNHHTYNVASGHATTNAEVAAAIRQVVPDAQVDLPIGGETRQAWLDITRLREDTGYEPAWDTERAAADYIAWLRAGNER
ncbi:MAG TPA: NAD(P)-dependent oxidoreductase, partial [Solirubrobacteraceae bacterium]|nr:NAD(P)-dependent oxidoreductase [Solirubrobacteraceae bacterium]